MVFNAPFGAYNVIRIVNEKMLAVKIKHNYMANKPEYTTAASVLRDIEWKRFETVCTEFLKMAGFAAKETKIGADGGVDIWVCKPGTEKSDGVFSARHGIHTKSVLSLFESFSAS